jgi:hypothetical protein
LHLSLIDSQNPTDVFFNQANKTKTVPPFVGEYREEAMSNQERRETSPGNKGIRSPQVETKDG